MLSRYWPKDMLDRTVWSIKLLQGKSHTLILQAPFFTTHLICVCDRTVITHHDPLNIFNSPQLVETHHVTKYSPQLKLEDI